MARKRMVDPGIWEDPGFNKLSHGARLLFIGMISNADDEGYLRADPPSLRRLVFGFDDTSSADVKQMLSECSRHLESVNVYAGRSEEQFVHLCNWNKYQKQQKDRIVPTLYPPCSKCVASAKHVLPEVSRVSSRSKELKKVSNDVVDNARETLRARWGKP